MESDITKEDAAVFAARLLSAALALPNGTCFTLTSLLEVSGLESEYKKYNRPGCQRIGKAFKSLTKPKTGIFKLPYIQHLGYNSQTKMLYMACNKGARSNA